MSNDAAPQSELATKLGDVRASVRPNLEISRHIFSGTPTYVIRDPVTAQNHRFSAQDYQLFISIDQSRTLKETVQLLGNRKVISLEETDSFYRFVVHLHQMGLLSLPLGDGSALYKRHKTRLDASKKGALLKLLFMKVPLVKPDNWLTHHANWFHPLFTPWAVMLWLACMCLCGFVLVANWQEFVSPLGTMLALSNVPTLWFLLVSLKVFHELGHAFACKRFGGQVPEMGAMVMMGTPCAYVDASSSWGFPNRWHRMIVALAGMYFESIAAMIALMIWLLTDTGRIHSAAQYAIVLSTVVTIGFNANPLMRYDGYFIFCDLVNIPNLHRDAKAATAAWIKRVLFGLPMPSSEWSWQKRAAMIGFGLLCMLYQLSVTLGIATLMLLAVPVFGPIVALFVSGIPASRFVTRMVKYVLFSKDLAPVRRRAVTVSSGLATVCFLGILLVPMPGVLQVQGVVHRLEEHSVRAAVDGFLLERLVMEGENVEVASSIFHLENRELRSQQAELVAQTQQLEVQLQSELKTDTKKAEQIRHQLESAEKQLADINTQLRHLSVTAQASGDFALPSEAPQIGKFIRKGEPLGKVCHGPWTIRAHLTAEQWADVSRHLNREAFVRLVGNPYQALHGRVIRAMPLGSKKIEDAALTHLGGGDIAVSPEMVASENFFEVVVQIDSSTDLPNLRMGMTAVVNLLSEQHTLGQFLLHRSLRLLNQIRQVGMIAH